MAALHGLTDQDIKDMVTNAAAETRFLDFKRDLDLSKDSAKREFLRDVCALANAGGGTLVFGIDEKDTKADKLVGLKSLNYDRVEQQICGLANTSLQPKLSGLEVNHHSPDGTDVISVHVAPSILRPHMIMHQGRYECWGRNGTSKHQMDIHEIRHYVQQSEQLEADIERFIRDRRVKIWGNQLALNTPASAPGIAMHILPLVSFHDSILTIEQMRELAPELQTIGYRGFQEPIVNFEGLLSPVLYNRMSSEHREHLQIFRNGAIEAAYFCDKELRNFDGGQLFPKLFEFVDRVTAKFMDLGISPPFEVFLELNNFSNVQFVYGTWVPAKSRRSTDELVTLPDISIDNTQPASECMKLLADRICNVFGLDEYEPDWRP